MFGRLLFGFRIAPVGAAKYCALLIASVIASSPIQTSGSIYDTQLRYLFAGMKQERSRIWSGSYEIEGAQSPLGSFKASVIFKKEKLRFIREIGQDNKKSMMRACDNGLVIATWNSGQNDCLLRKSNIAERNILYHWDPRTAGLAVFSDSDLRQVLARRLENWLSRSTVSAKENLHEIEFKSASEFQDVSTFLIVNADQGFTPLRNYAEVRFKRNSNFPDKVELNYDVTAQWEKSGDVWIPIQHRDTNSEGSVVCEYALKWNWVNRDIDDKQFEAEALDLPPGIRTFDFRNATSENPAGEERLQTTPLPTSNSNVIYLAVALVACLGMVWLGLRVRSRN